MKRYIVIETKNEMVGHDDSGTIWEDRGTVHPYLFEEEADALQYIKDKKIERWDVQLLDDWQSKGGV